MNGQNKTKQAECYWCTSDIFGEKVVDVKTYWYCTIIQEIGIVYWNKGNYGFPICDKCIGNFRYGNHSKIEVPIVQNMKGLDKWLNSA